MGARSEGHDTSGDLVGSICFDVDNPEHCSFIEGALEEAYGESYDSSEFHENNYCTNNLSKLGSQVLDARAWFFLGLTDGRDLLLDHIEVLAGE